MVFQMDYDEFVAALNMLMVKLYEKKQGTSKEELKPFEVECELVVRKILTGVPGEILKAWDA